MCVFHVEFWNWFVCGVEIVVELIEIVVESGLNYVWNDWVITELVEMVVENEN